MVAAGSKFSAVWAAPFRYGVSTYLVIALPLFAGATQLTVALFSPTADTVGEAGVAGPGVAAVRLATCTLETSWLSVIPPVDAAKPKASCLGMPLALVQVVEG